MRKTHLAGTNSKVYPHRAAIAVHVAPWGVQQVYIVHFRGVGRSAWTLRLPVTPNSTVQWCGAFHASSTGECTVVNRAGEKQSAEILVPRTIATAGKLMFMILTVQPISFRRIFMQWLPFGTPDRPCKLSLRFNLDDLPHSFRAVAALRRGCGKNGVINMAGAHQTLLCNTENANLTVRIGHPQGFHVPNPVYALRDDGTCDVIQGQGEAWERGSFWFIKGGTKEKDNLMLTYSLARPPSAAMPAVNGKLLRYVAEAMVRKGHRRPVYQSLGVENVSRKVKDVADDPLCWSVTAPRTLCAEHPYVETLCEAKRHLDFAGEDTSELNHIDTVESPAQMELSDIVKSVIGAVLE